MTVVLKVHIVLLVHYESNRIITVPCFHKEWVWPKLLLFLHFYYYYYCYYNFYSFSIVFWFWFYFYISLTYLHKVDSNIIWWRESIVCPALVLSKVRTSLELHTHWTDATCFLFQLWTIRFSPRDRWNRNSICIACQCNCLTDPWGIIGGESSSFNECLVCWSSENKMSLFI